MAVSTDLGLSWTTAGPSLPWMAATASADGMRFAAVAVEVFVLPVGQTRHIYTTADGGVNWTARLSSGRLSYYPFPSIAMSADGGRLIAAESGGTLLTSTDAGATWVPEEVARYWTGVAVSGNGRVLVACADAGPIVTSARQVLGPDLVMELHYAGNGRWEPTLFTTVSSQGVLNPERIPAALTGVHTFDSAVGIGTDTPVASLDVRGNLSVVPTTPAAGISLTGAGMPTAYYLKDGTGERGALGLALQDTNYSDDAAPGDIVLRSAGNPAGKLMLQNGPGAAALTVVGNRVGIGTTAPGTALEVRGNVLVQGTVTQTSDARFKSRVASLGNALDTIEALRGVKFEWTPERQTAPGHVGRQLGFLAQEVATVLPELVHTNTDGYLSLNYSGLTPVLVEAVKELEQRIATRLADKDAQIVALERRQLTKDTELDALRTRMSELEATLARLATRQTASDPHPVTGHRDPDAQ